jgi:TfoX/Sxy family transcriptional regulator of competence genes
MAWIKVPPENHPIFYAALPKDRRVVTMQLFGGVGAKVNGHFFAGLFQRSTMVLLAESDRSEALALEGAGPFDPMGDGRASDKVMLPDSIMEEPEELARWIARAFEYAAALPAKKSKATSRAKNGAKAAKSSKAASPAKTAPKRSAAKPVAKPARRRGKK